MAKLALVGLNTSALLMALLAGRALAGSDEPLVSVSSSGPFADCPSAGLDESFRGTVVFAAAWTGEQLVATDGHRRPAIGGHHRPRNRRPSRQRHPAYNPPWPSTRPSAASTWRGRTPASATGSLTPSRCRLGTAPGPGRIRCRPTPPPPTSRSTASSVLAVVGGGSQRDPGRQLIGLPPQRRGCGAADRSLAAALPPSGVAAVCTAGPQGDTADRLLVRHAPGAPAHRGWAARLLPGRPGLDQHRQRLPGGVRPTPPARPGQRVRTPGDGPHVPLGTGQLRPASVALGVAADWAIGLARPR